ncbi:cyclopropane fatty acid synthase [Gymnopus androsaceus JB14]|uniref:Cyclopropane fatty acid synthase n=1 Tax=Gymnopus androsaceus JB14 TaxID=1447944 RepID=A0A6A4GWH1_9AGAR|nr:cyclopropane fatty acid synthase [Gymnopus androsaceus JB14]
MHDKTWQAYIIDGGLLGGYLSRILYTYGRSRILLALQTGIQIGEMVLEDQPSGEIYHFGVPAAGQSPAVIKIKDKKAWGRIFLTLDLGFSEAYMKSEVDSPDLKSVFDIWLNNRQTLDGISSIASAVSGYFSAAMITLCGRQSIKMAKWNVEIAYDTSNDFYRCFLSQDMMYSCALWDGDDDGGVRGDIERHDSDVYALERAQQRKIAHILSKARVQAGDHILEIGSGWGALAISAAKMGCTVETVTLSSQQKHMVEARAKAEGVEKSVHVHLTDYRQLPSSFAGSFDAFISCEMIEAVGPAHRSTYFKMIDWALKKRRGTVVITATSQPEFRFSMFQSNCFARHYHWPNTFLPSATALPGWVQSATPGRLVLVNLEDHNMHYPRTLREWNRRLELNFHGDIVERLQKEYPQLNDLQNLESFRRKWKYMFAYAEAGYAKGYTSLNCWTFTRPENIGQKCD